MKHKRPLLSTYYVLGQGEVIGNPPPSLKELTDNMGKCLSCVHNHTTYQKTCGIQPPSSSSPCPGSGAACKCLDAQLRGDGLGMGFADGYLCSMNQPALSAADSGKDRHPKLRFIITR